jgi:hypothetical protein
MAHKTTAGNSSDAWKGLEYRFAELLNRAGFLGAHRIIKEAHDSRPDVDVPEIPDLAIDTKYSEKAFNTIHSLFMAQVETYVDAKRKGVCAGSQYTWGLMPIRPKGSPDILVILRAEKFIELLQKVFIRNEPKPGAWLCPRCPTEVVQIGESLGLKQFQCPACQLSFLTDQIEGKEKREMIASNRKKGPKGEKVIIKDKSAPPPTASGHDPLPGQLTVSDLVNRKNNPPKPRTRRKKTP